ncbi:MAG TPA: hypothetical protein VK505_08075 [Steroidobacteraceae bacterium]|jgi:hypothetical protein|nr:hypothetical protein [Steroidobacteraceae bacterium]
MGAALSAAGPAHESDRADWWLGGLLERMSGTQFWLLHAALVGGATVAMLVAWQMFAHPLAPTGPKLERVPA